VLSPSSPLLNCRASRQASRRWPHYVSPPRWRQPAGAAHARVHVPLQISWKPRPRTACLELGCRDKISYLFTYSHISRLTTDSGRCWPEAVSAAGEACRPHHAPVASLVGNVLSPATDVAVVLPWNTIGTESHVNHYTILLLLLLHHTATLTHTTLYLQTWIGLDWAVFYVPANTA